MIAAALCVLLAAAPEANSFSDARALYFRGADGDPKAYGKAAELFEHLHREKPADPLVTVYYGSLRLVEASHTWALWKKNSLSKEGIRLMDSAVEAHPENLEIRFVRAATTYDLPGFFHRKDQSRDDFAFLAPRAAAAAHAGTLDPRLAAASLYYHGEFRLVAKRPAEATAAWKEAIALAPASRAARESREALAKAGSN